MMSGTDKARIGYVGGKPHRVNERVIDGQWTAYLGEYAETVAIAPMVFLKLFGGSIDDWLNRYPQSLPALAEALDLICRKYRLQWLYVNLPMLAPYLLMARNYGGLDLGLILIAHSVGSEFWLRQWLGVAPGLRRRDLLIAASDSCRDALMNISGRYAMSRRIPLCIDCRATATHGDAEPAGEGLHLLSIGRLEKVKNIHKLVEWFAQIRREMPAVHLTIAGEYTEQAAGQGAAYKARIAAMVREHGLEEHVTFAGAVEAEVKDFYFRRSDVLVNLSTDPGETFGYNLIEAKIWGLPVVCTNWDGFAEIVGHGIDGYRIDCGWSGDEPEINGEQFVQSCLRLLKNENERRQFSVNARRRARTYDYKRIMPELVAFMAASETNASESDVALPYLTPLAELGEWFGLERLKLLPFRNEPLLRIFSSPPTLPPDDWIRFIKPVISHFAGGV